MPEVAACTGCAATMRLPSGAIRTALTTALTRRGEQADARIGRRTPGHPPSRSPCLARPATAAAGNGSISSHLNVQLIS